MAFDVHIKITRRFKVRANYDKVFALLADVPESVSHFPKVDELYDLGDNIYRWEMQKIGIDKYSLQTIYTCQYTADKKAGTVTWEPFEEEDTNGIVSGKWTIRKADAKSTNVTLSNTADLTVPLPKISRFLVSGMVESEFESLIDQYIDNLKATFEK